MLCLMVCLVVLSLEKNLRSILSETLFRFCETIESCDKTIEATVSRPTFDLEFLFYCPPPPTLEWNICPWLQPQGHLEFQGGACFFLRVKLVSGKRASAKRILTLWGLWSRRRDQIAWRHHGSDPRGLKTSVIISISYQKQSPFH